jgi:hypothetical protein
VAADRSLCLLAVKGKNLAVGSISTYLTRDFSMKKKRSREVAKTFTAFNLSAQDLTPSGTQEIIFYDID